MRQDFETDNYIGAGEVATLHILKHLTGLQHVSLKKFGIMNGIFTQVPIEWIMSQRNLELLSKMHRRSSVDLFIQLNQIRIAVRVQGEGHGFGLRGIGKAKMDNIQRLYLQDSGVQVVDIKLIECKEVFKERVTNKAINEVIESFRTDKVLIPELVYKGHE